VVGADGLEPPTYAV